MTLHEPGGAVVDLADPRDGDFYRDADGVMHVYSDGRWSVDARAQERARARARARRREQALRRIAGLAYPVRDGSQAEHMAWIAWEALDA